MVFSQVGSSFLARKRRFWLKWLNFSLQQE